MTTQTRRRIWAATIVKATILLILLVLFARTQAMIKNGLELARSTLVVWIVLAFLISGIGFTLETGTARFDAWMERRAERKNA